MDELMAYIEEMESSILQANEALLDIANRQFEEHIRDLSELLEKVA